MNWIATALSLLGNWFVIKKKVHGFWIWLVANVLWALLAWKSDDPAQLLMWFVYGVLNIKGILEWRKPNESLSKESTPNV
jgi:nicotinamide riboside transporter PnuC